MIRILLFSVFRASYAQESCKEIPLEFRHFDAGGSFLKIEKDQAQRTLCGAVPHAGFCRVVCPEDSVVTGADPQNAIQCFDGIWSGKPFCKLTNQKSGGGSADADEESDNDDSDDFPLWFLAWIIPSALLLCLCAFLLVKVSASKEETRNSKLRDGSVLRSADAVRVLKKAASRSTVQSGEYQGKQPFIGPLPYPGNAERDFSPYTQTKAFPPRAYNPGLKGSEVFVREKTPGGYQPDYLYRSPQQLSHETHRDFSAANGGRDQKAAKSKGQKNDWGGESNPSLYELVVIDERDLTNGAFREEGGVFIPNPREQSHGENPENLFRCLHPASAVMSAMLGSDLHSSGYQERKPLERGAAIPGYHGDPDFTTGNGQQLREGKMSGGSRQPAGYQQSLAQAYGVRKWKGATPKRTNEVPVPAPRGNGDARSRSADEYLRYIERV